MQLPRIALLAGALLLGAACGNDDDATVGDATEPPLGGTGTDGTGTDGTEDGGVLLESQGSLGDPVVYRGGGDAEDGWELTVTAREVECDLDVGGDVEVEPAEDRLCAVHLEVENTGGEPNLTTFAESSSVVADDDGSYPIEEIATGLYAEQQGRELTAVPPGETSEQSLVFSVPSGAEPTHLQLQAAASDEVVVIELASS